MRKIAIIPARGGSKRIPKKNIIDFMGKPMIAWTIEAALESGLFDRVLVSTDSVEVARIAEDWGASVPFLRNAAYDDHSPVSLATCVALQQCEENLNEDYDIVAQLMANAPLRTDEDIKEAMTHFIASSAPSQISCFRFGWMNPWWAVTLDSSGQPNPLFPEMQLERSQDLPALYCPSGAIWISQVEELLEHQTFYCPSHIFHPIPWQSAVDIDDEEDLIMAAVVFEMRNRI
jgi:N-acylneuraminate cytidylyltransferase